MTAPFSTGPALPPAPTPAGGDHLKALDGLRGLAALVVMLGHSAYVYVDSGRAHGRLEALLKIVLRGGHPSVILFFSLSGFVLYLAFVKRPGTSYATYLTRRVFRIYPAFLAALALALALHLILAPTPQPGLGPWTLTNMVYPADPVMALRHVLMLGVFSSDIALDPVIWSLVIELRFSIVLVLLALLCGRSRIGLLALVILAHVAGRVVATRMHLPSPYIFGGSALGAAAITLFYLPSFGFGILAADLVLNTDLPRRLRLPHWAQVVVCAGAFAAAKLINDDLAWAVAATAIIFIAAAQGPVSSLLRLDPCLFLGRVSYSLYLVHLPILLALVYVLQPHVGLVLPVLLSPALSLGVAAGMYRWIELPGIALGKTLTADHRAAATRGA
ncbi:acyltransferase [Phenylobacterium sp.]|uniref:acyltransferase family protein n=1 Tax=Phenylobacterium sp. TaxID=1871053 RepID=UPI00286A8F4D|nr:acyltransferase [Phenylobacterium sp.]